VLLFLVWWCNPGLFSPVFRIAFYEPPGQILGAAELVDRAALTSFLGNCQFKYGGIAKAPGEHAGRDFMSLPYEYAAKPLSRSIPHVPLARGDRYVSTTGVRGRRVMGYRTLGSLDQREAVDCTMG